jgi:hypothetical protein
MTNLSDSVVAGMDSRVTSWNFSWLVWNRTSILDWIMFIGITDFIATQ